MKKSKLKSKFEVDGVKLGNKQVRIMQLLLEKNDGGLYQRLLARNLRIIETTAKHNIGRLEGMGLLKTWGRNPKFVGLTRKGRKIAKKILEGVLRKPNVLLPQLPPDGRNYQEAKIMEFPESPVQGSK